MIKPVTMYTVICDRCGLDGNSGNGIAAWSTAESAWDVARDCDWAEIADKHYCPDCYEFNPDNRGLLRAKPELCQCDAPIIRDTEPDCYCADCGRDLP